LPKLLKESLVETVFLLRIECGLLDVLPSQSKINRQKVLYKSGFFRLLEREIINIIQYYVCNYRNTSHFILRMLRYFIGYNSPDIK